MAKSDALSRQPLTPREKEVLALWEKGVQKGREISKELGLGITGGSYYLSTLRRKGYIPLLEDNRNYNALKEVETPEKLAQQSMERAQQLLNERPPGSAFSRKKILIDLQPEERPNRNLRVLAKMLDDALHQHVVAGHKLGEWERLALMLTGEILK